MWLPPGTMGTSLNRFTFHTATPSATQTHEATATEELGIIVQNGFGYSGVYSQSDAAPLVGTEMTWTTFGNFPVGQSGSAGMFVTHLVIGSYLWLIPYNSNMVVKMNYVKRN